MTKQKSIDTIVEIEWNMFHTVNGENRAFCQDDRRTFEIMRRAQYAAWSEEAVNCFRRDITAAEQAGRNLSREKYIRMMKHSDPAGYAAFAQELPALTPRQEQLAAELWNRLLVQTERMRERYPLIALGGRPLRARDEHDGWTSVETYQLGESLTYSEATLEALLRHLEALEAQGVDLAFEIQKNTVFGLGFSSMDAAEWAMQAQTGAKG